ncbi:MULTISPECIES: hypothetical protein [unclassified Haladaptatus]|nr:MULTISPECIES: hypothetical protein [unclassified Haladaptatus]
MGQTISLAEESMIEDRPRRGRTGDDHEMVGHRTTERPVGDR